MGGVTRILVVGPGDGAWRNVQVGIGAFAQDRPGWRLERCRPGQLAARIAGADGVLAAIDAVHLPPSPPCPLVLLRPIVGDRGLPMVVVDEAAIGRLAAEHLLATRIRHFAAIAPAGGEHHRLRLAGFARCLRRAGHDCRLRHRPDRLAAWLRGLPRPCGVFASGPDLGPGLSWACEEAGLAVPDEIALIGVDDDPAPRTWARPMLTAVQLPGVEQGRRAAATLDRLLAGCRVAARRRLQPWPVFTRASTDLVLSDDPAVAQALRLMRRDLGREFDVAALAAAVDLGRRRFEQRFRAALGRSPHRELMRLRHARVRSLLRTSEDTVAAIAARCGYASAQHLATCFRREESCTPGEWRDRHRRRFRPPGAGLDALA